MRLMKASAGAVVLAATGFISLAAGMNVETSADLPQLTVAGSPYEIGRQIGEAFGEMILSRLTNDSEFQNTIIPFSKTEQGRSVYNEFLNNHRSWYPDYISEIAGLAAGSNIPFKHLFLLNLRKELSYFTSGEMPKNTTLGGDDHCSDVMFLSGTEGYEAHNEDAACSDEGHIYFVCVTTNARRSFCAYNYAGELPSAAFGFNDKLLAYSCNALSPMRIDVNGRGRNFINRHLLDAKTFEEAVEIATVANQAVGQNHQIFEMGGSASSSRIATIESAPHNESSLLILNASDSNATTYFHANEYIRLSVAQIPQPSSMHREERYRELGPPQNLQDIYEILGDTKDKEYPIFRTGQHDTCTLSTTIFDLVNGTITTYEGNPKLNPTVILFAQL